MIYSFIYIKLRLIFGIFSFLKMFFIHMREIFAKNSTTCIMKLNICSGNICLKFRLFSILEKIFCNLLTIFFDGNLKSIMSSLNQKTIIDFKFIKLIKKIKIIAEFKDIFSSQCFDWILLKLSLSIKFIFDEFRKLVSKLYEGIYEGWVSLFSFWFYLYPSALSIEILFNMIKFLLKKKTFGIFLVPYIERNLSIKNYYQNNLIFQLIYYHINLDFCYLINTSLLFGLIKDINGIYIKIWPSNIKKQYHLIIKNFLSFPQRKILKYSIMICMLLKNIPKWRKKIKLFCFRKCEIISTSTMRTGNLIVFLEKCIQKISNFILTYVINKNTLIYCFQTIFFFFCFLNGNLYKSIDIILNKKGQHFVNIIKILFNLINNQIHYGCFFVEFSDCTFNKSVISIYFKNFFIRNPNDIFFSLDDFLTRYNFDKISLNCILDYPISYFVSKNSIKKYQIIGKYFFKIKLVEKSLINIWKTQISLYYLTFIGITRKTLFLNQRIAFFFNSIINYTVSDVLEKNWMDFVRRIEKICNIKIILKSHENFLNKCIEECFLNNSKIFRIVTRIIAIARLFSFFINKFSNIIRLEIQRSRRYQSRTINNHLYDINYFNKLNIFKSNYENEMKQLTKNLHSDDKKKRYPIILERTLNFNRFYNKFG
nr:gamma-tubulin complex component 2 [Cryptomonas sp.]